MRAFARLLGTTSAALCSLVAGAAQAQINVPNSGSVTALPPATSADSVEAARRADQASAALEPVGAHFGSFTVLPRMEAGLVYDSNIYALERNTDDFIVKLSPSVTLNGDFATYTNTIRVALDRYNYLDNKRENRTDYAIGGNHRLELAPQTFLTANAAYSRNHEDRGDPNSIQSSRSPVRYDLMEAAAGFARDLSTLRLGADVGIRRYNYADSAQLGGGVTNNDDRDRNQFRAAGRLGFELSPGYTVVGRLAYEKIDYDDRLDDFGFNRSSDGYRASIGVGFELTRLLIGEVFGGWIKRSFEDPRFGNISDPLFGASLTWNPTELTTVRLNADRTVEETIAIGYRAYLATGASVNVEHELMRTLRLSGTVRYSRNKYERASISTVGPRKDDNYGASLVLRYILNRNVYTSLGYDYSARGSTATGIGSDFKRNKVLATLGVQF